MRGGRRKPSPEEDASDIAFPPPYSDQGKYLILADKFLSSGIGSARKRDFSQKGFQTRQRQEAGVTVFAQAAPFLCQLLFANSREAFRGLKSKCREVADKNVRATRFLASRSLTIVNVAV
jgi:hypothetical protein